MEIGTSMRILLSAALSNKVREIVTVRLRPKHRNKHQRAALPACCLQQRKQIINISLKLIQIETLILSSVSNMLNQN